MTQKNFKNLIWLYFLVPIIMFLFAFYPNAISLLKTSFAMILIAVIFFLLVFFHALKNNRIKIVLIFFLSIITVSFAAEVAGTHLGVFPANFKKPLIFEGDKYFYADFFPLKIFDVPLTLIFMWCFVIYVAYYLATLLIEKLKSNSKFKFLKKQKISIYFSVFFAAIIATLWDALFDPLATKLGFWTWVNSGSTFPSINGGIPFGNFTAWFFITLLSLTLFLWIAKKPLVFKRDLNGAALAISFAMFIFMFALPQKEYLILIVGMIVLIGAWLICFLDLF